MFDALQDANMLNRSQDNDIPAFHVLPISFMNDLHFNSSLTFTTEIALHKCLAEMYCLPKALTLYGQVGVCAIFE